MIDPAKTEQNLLDENAALKRRIRELESVEEALRESEAKFRSVYEASPIGIELYDRKGALLDANGVCAEIFGLSSVSAIKGFKLFEDPNLDEELKERLRNFESVRYEIPFDFDKVRERGLYETAKSGTIYLDLLITPLKEASRESDIAYLVHIRDITERKRAEEEKRSLAERLQRVEKLEAIGTLAGGVAHDLNNLLGVLVGCAELLLLEMKQTDPLRELAESIMTSGEQAAAEVQDLLTMARRGVVLREPASLNRIVADQLSRAEIGKMLSLHPHVAIETQYDPDLLGIKASVIHVERVLNNLVSNALHAITEKGGITIRTENRYLDRPLMGYEEIFIGEYAVLSLSDTGNGIVPEHLKHLFEPFYMRKMVRQGETGLGLSIIWGVLKDHDGYVDVSSEPGRGTTFNLYFPATRDSAVMGKEKPADRYMGQGETILVADDEEAQCRLAERMLTRLNYGVKTVGSGEEALDYLAGHDVDLVLLDMIMDPGMDGYDTYRKILEIRKGQKVILLSGFTKTERVKMAQDLGAGEFIRKPYLLERLGIAVRKKLDRKREGGC